MYLPHVTILLNNDTNKRVSNDTCDNKHCCYYCHSDFSWFGHDYLSVGHDHWKYYIKKMNTYLAMDLLRTLYIKRKTIGRPAYPHLESLRRPPVTIKGLMDGERPSGSIYKGLRIKTKSTKKRRNYRMCFFSIFSSAFIKWFSFLQSIFVTMLYKLIKCTK